GPSGDESPHGRRDADETPGPAEAAGPTRDRGGVRPADGPRARPRGGSGLRRGPPSRPLPPAPPGLRVTSDGRRQARARPPFTARFAAARGAMPPSAAFLRPDRQSAGALPGRG